MTGPVFACPDRQISQVFTNWGNHGYQVSRRKRFSQGNALFTKPVTSPICKSGIAQMSNRAAFRPPLLFCKNRSLRQPLNTLLSRSRSEKDQIDNLPDCLQQACLFYRNLSSAIRIVYSLSSEPWTFGGIGRRVFTVQKTGIRNAQFIPPFAKAGRTELRRVYIITK
mgnify:CR=1 FL=1